MAPCTYIRLALRTTLGGRTHFENLEFTDIDGPAPVDGLFPGQALRFGGLDFIANQMGSYALAKGIQPYRTPRCLTIDRPSLVPRSSILMR
jgi:hypothetical protein